MKDWGRRAEASIATISELLYNLMVLSISIHTVLTHTFNLHLSTSIEELYLHHRGWRPDCP